MDLFGSVLGFEGGNAVRFCHFVFFGSGSLFFVVFFPFFLSQGRCLKKFSGANFCFWVLMSVVFILVFFFHCFCFVIWFVVPGNVS